MGTRYRLHHLAGVLAIAAGCGKTDSGSSQFRDGDGGRGQGARGAATGTGAASAGNGADTSMGGAGASSGSGNASGNSSTGGTGTGGNGTGGADTAGAGGGVNGGATTGGSSGISGTTGAGGAIANLDPNAAERRAVATEYCALLEQYECLIYSAQRGSSMPTDRSELAELCRRDIEVLSAFWPEQCFPEWRDHMQCLTDAPWVCPCELNDCVLASPGQLPTPFGDICASTSEALGACSQAYRAGAPVLGTTGECYYFVNAEQGCYAECFRDVGAFTMDCDGPPGGAQICGCSLNGVRLKDSVTDRRFWADDCAGAAQIMADGACEDLLSCCVSWTEGDGGVPQCRCTADPTVAGFATCEEAAAAVAGETVDLCPQHQIDWNGFPEAP